MIGMEVWQTLVDFDTHRNVAGLGLGFDHVRGVDDCLTDIYVFLIEQQRAGIDTGEVEDVVDQRQEVLAAFQDVVGVVLVARASERPESFRRHQFGEAEYRIEGCAQFMAHRCKELRLCLIGRSRGAERHHKFPGCVFELALGFLEFGNIGAQALRLFHGAVGQISADPAKASATINTVMAATAMAMA